MRRVSCKKLLALLLACLMVLTLTPFAFAEEYGDVVEGSFGEEAIKRWTDAGVVHGKGDGVFDPNGTLTRVEGATILVNLLRLKTDENAVVTAFEDVEEGAWYVPYVAAASEAKIMNGYGDGNFGPMDTMTREMYFVVVCNALGISPATEAAEDQKEFPDKDDVDGWAKGYVDALLNMGMVGGEGTSEGDILNPTGKITRESVMSLLDNMIGGYAYEDGTTVEAEAGKFTLVVADNVTVTGEVDKPIVVASDDATVDLKGVTGTVEVIVNADDVELTNVPKDATIVTPEANTVIVNGNEVTTEANTPVEAPAEKAPSTSNPGSYTPPISKPERRFSVYFNGNDVCVIGSTDRNGTYKLTDDITMYYGINPDAVVRFGAERVSFDSVTVGGVEVNATNEPRENGTYAYFEFKVDQIGGVGEQTEIVIKYTLD